MQRYLQLNRTLQFQEKETVPNFLVINDFNEKALLDFSREFEKMRSSDPDILPVVVDSSGGDVASLFGFVELIKSSTTKIATIVTSKAMSAAVVLFSCGTPGFRFVAPLATLMIHEVSSDAFGKISEMKSATGYGEVLNENLFALLDQNCKKKKGFFRKEIQKRGNADWFLTAQEAKKLGLADHIRVPDLYVKAKLEVCLK